MNKPPFVMLILIQIRYLERQIKLNNTNEFQARNKEIENYVEGLRYALKCFYLKEIEASRVILKPGESLHSFIDNLIKEG